MGEMYTLTRGIAISFLTCSELYSAGLKKKNSMVIKVIL